MKALRALTVANIRGYLRDRQALFWTLAFPLIFVVLFGAIFSGGDSTITVAWVDQDASPASAQLRAAFAAAPNVKLVDTTQEAGLEAMKTGENSGVIVVPKGYAEVVATAGVDPTQQTTIAYYIDPSQQTTAGTMTSYVNGVLAQVNLGGRPVAIVSAPRPIQTERLNAVSYLVPSILGMALMQTGIFAAIPIVADRQKLILKRLAATPLKRWQLIGSNVIMRMLIALVQFVLIVGVGVLAFNVQIVGSLLGMAALAILGSLAFTATGLRDRHPGQDRGRGERDDQRRPVPDDVPVGHVLPDRAHAPGSPDGRPVPAPDLPLGRPPPGHGRRGRLRPAVGLRRGPGRLDGGLLRFRGATLPVAVARPAEPATSAPGGPSRPAAGGLPVGAATLSLEGSAG